MVLHKKYLKKSIAKSEKPTNFGFSEQKLPDIYYNYYKIIFLSLFFLSLNK